MEVNETLYSVLLGKHSYELKLSKASIFYFKPSSIKTFLEILMNICGLHWKETGNIFTHYIREPRQKMQSYHEETLRVFSPTNYNIT